MIALWSKPFPTLLSDPKTAKYVVGFLCTLAFQWIQSLDEGGKGEFKLSLALTCSLGHALELAMFSV